MPKSIKTILNSDGPRELFHSVGAATAKLCIPMCLLGLVDETGRWLPCVSSLHLIKEDRYGGWLNFIALYVSCI